MLDAVHEYSAKRLIPTGRNETTPLAHIPVMRDTLEEIQAVMCVMRHFTKSVEDSFITVRNHPCALRFSANFCHKRTSFLRACILFDVSRSLFRQCAFSAAFGVG